MKVLISSGYGAGWSTWNGRELAVDKGIIDLFEKGCTVHEMEKFCKSKGYEDIYMGGFYDLKVVEVPKGTCFCIREYDGAEYIEIMEEQNWFYAED